MVDIRNQYGVPGDYDFANVSVWNPAIFDKIPAGQKISFVPILADWIGAGGKIGGLVLNENAWFNIGHGALGFTLACGTAQLLADRMARRVNPIAHAVFRL